MPIHAVQGSREALQHLPTRARPRVDPSDVPVPEGYSIEPVLVGLTFPNDFCFDRDGTICIGEGGSTWPTRPAPPPRILKLDPLGNLEEFVSEIMPGPRGLAIHDEGLGVCILPSRGLFQPDPPLGPQDQRENGRHRQVAGWRLA